MSPRWNDAPGDALRAVRLRVVKEEEEEEEEDTKTSSALPKREEIIERFGLFGTPRRSNDSDDDEEEENKKCEMEFTTGTCSNGKTCNRCDRWQRFVDGIGGRAASLTTKKHYEVFTSDLVRGVVRRGESCSGCRGTVSRRCRSGERRRSEGCHERETEKVIRCHSRRRRCEHR